MENLDTQNLVLGKSTRYYEDYSPSLLQPISRSLGRASLSQKEFFGYDLWRIYELCYLNANGIPQVAWGYIRVNAKSEFIVESKSLKLYLGSFTMTKFADLAEVEAIIQHDLTNVLHNDVCVKLFDLEICAFPISSVNGILIDKEITLEKVDYTYNPQLLKCDLNQNVEETLSSNILRTLCPVTSQPDHATVFINYKGPKIDRQALFAYLCSLRHHQGFHEQCTEMIYSDILINLKPQELTVTACFTRRGGIDINPVRTNLKEIPCHIARCYRQ